MKFAQRCLCIQIHGLSGKRFSKKKDFYRNLIIEDITDADCKQVRRVCKEFETNKQTNKKKQKTGEYHDLQVQRNTLFLADAFQSFRNMCLKINGLHPVHFLSTPMSA